MPALASYLKLPTQNFGGWMSSCAQYLSDCGIKLAIASIYSGKTVQKISIDRITYYRIPYGNNDYFDSHSIPFWEMAINDFSPDLIHIHGTEYPCSYAMIAASRSIPAVASIQGLVSVSERYYNAGLTSIDLLQTVALRDLVHPTKTWLPFARHNMARRGKWEKKAILQLDHVIGRTSWDRAHVLAIHPEISYHFCNETLREKFYTADKWQYGSCEKHTIFASNPSYPLKGVHQLIKALVLVVRRYPDAKLKIAGNDIIHLSSIKEYLRLPGYSLYLRRLIKKLHLEQHILFLGNLSAEQMVEEFQKAHCFILPSSIENSSNTLGEAQLLGVPSIASYAGGNPDMIDDGVDGYLYRFDEVEMLAQKIMNIWQKGSDITSVSNRAIGIAEKRHCREGNGERLLAIYREIVETTGQKNEIHSQIC